MSNTKEIVYKPISFSTLLGVAFIVLKLCNVITWNWWWVTLPIWGGFALLAVFVIIGIAFILIKG